MRGSNHEPSQAPHTTCNTNAQAEEIKDLRRIAAGDGLLIQSMLVETELQEDSQKQSQ
jgi:hypothetical protein